MANFTTWPRQPATLKKTVGYHPMKKALKLSKRMLSYTQKYLDKILQQA